jgi:putative hydrolase of the HAD superfamily
LRERLSESECENFEARLLRQTAERTGLSEARIGELVAEWMERRPLRRLAACRYEGLPALFAGLSASGRIVGVLSDYPAAAKLKALGLCADHVVWAGDAGVGVMKPHPRGLELLMARANSPPENTVLIGDRIDRDGVAATRAGARCLIRSAAPREGCMTFARYDSPLFAALRTGARQ